jgi:hypothetical protein
MELEPVDVLWAIKAQLYPEYRQVPNLQQLVGAMPWRLKLKANPLRAATYQLYPQVLEAYLGMLPTNEDWQRLLESALPKRAEDKR